MSAPVDWTAPLELIDGTPVRLAAGCWGSTDTGPDTDGDYWIMREDGAPFGTGPNAKSCQAGMLVQCVADEDNYVRNREQGA